MARKKYSLQQRLAYHSKTEKREWEKYDKTGKKSRKLQYAVGFRQGAERGHSLNYNELPKFERLGQDAGIKAREKSENVKF